MVISTVPSALQTRVLWFSESPIRSGIFPDQPPPE
jgi:hypothetical protein